MRCQEMETVSGILRDYLTGIVFHQESENCKTKRMLELHGDRYKGRPSEMESHVGKDAHSWSVLRIL